MIAKFLKFLWSLVCHTANDDKPDSPAQAPAPFEQGIASPTAKLRVPGKEIELAGTIYIVAPLNAAAVKQYRDQIKTIFVGSMPDIELVAKLAYCSLQRNYPDITMEKVEQLIDYSNYFTVWEEMLNLSGLVAQAGEMVRRVQEQMETQGLKA